MSWTGRKRSPGDRYPSGDRRLPKPPKPPDQPHRKGFGSNPLAETVHGRYYLTKAISEPQHLAGTYYGRSRLRYRAAIGSPDSLRSRSEGQPIPTGEYDGVEIAHFNGVILALGKLRVDVDWVIVQDAMLADLTNYRRGLDVLRTLYRV